MKLFADGLHKFLDVIYPKECIICSDAVASKIPVCDDCMKEFANLFASPCPICKNDRNNCTCNEKGDFLFYYGNYASRAVIASVKHSGDLRMIDFFAEMLYQSVSKQRKFDAVVFPPRSKENNRKYGYDHAKALAESLAKKLGIPVCYAVKRNKKSVEQKLLSASQRIKNAKNAFYVENDGISGIKRVLLVDDIYTTGATTRAISEKLRLSGVKNIKVITIAKAVRKKKPKKKSNEKFLFRYKVK